LTFRVKTKETFLDFKVSCEQCADVRIFDVRMTKGCANFECADVRMKNSFKYAQYQFSAIFSFAHPKSAHPHIKSLSLQKFKRT